MDVPPRRADDAENNQLGKYFLSLDDDPSWVIRRVETVKLVDSDRVERRITLDIDLVELKARALAAGYTDAQAKNVLVPLSLCVKDLIVDYDILDIDGRSLSVLPSDCDARVAQLMMAEALVGSPQELGSAHQQLLHKLYEIAKSFPTLQDRYLVQGMLSGNVDAWSIREKDVPDPAVRKKWIELFSNETFLRLVSTFTTSYMPIVSLPVDGADKTIVKFRYVDRGAQTTKGFLGALALAPVGYFVEPPMLGHTPRWHLRIVAPEETHVTSIGLSEIVRNDEGKTGVSPAILSDVTYDSRTVPERGLLHLESDSRLTSTYLAGMSLVPDLAGFIQPALASAIVSALILGAGAIAEAASVHVLTQTISGSLDAAIALLLLIPSAYALHASRPGEHTIRASLLFWPRAILVSSVGAVIVASIAVLIGKVLPSGVLAWTWGGAAIWAALTAGYLGAVAGRLHGILQRVRTTGSLTLSRPIPKVSRPRFEKKGNFKKLLEEAKKTSKSAPEETI